jgi:hypothetical protein
MSRPRLACRLVAILAARLTAALILILAISGPAQAVTIDWVTVGDPGNACDIQSQGCFGAVAYTYQIGKYEVTNAQYAEFLNAVADTDTYWPQNLTTQF